MEIRRATLWDAIKIAKLWEQQIEEKPLFLFKSNDKELERFYINIQFKIKTEVVCVAEEKEEIVGYISGKTYNRKYGSSHLIGLCENLYVIPKYRNFEASSKLMNTAVELLKQKGVEEIQFITLPELRTYRAMRERQGYKPVFAIYCENLNGYND